MKYPIGIQDFESIINNGYVYVDKTALIYRLVTEGKIYFLSRPRRFGKSLLISTLEAYFNGQKELFQGLAIDDLETEWAEYPVFHLDFNGEDYTTPGKLEEKIIGAVETWEAEYGRDPYKQALGDRFIYVLAQAAKKYNRRAVVLIDEYDKPILDVLDTDTSIHIHGEQRLLEDHHRNILKGFYSTFKAADANLQFVLLTGVTKFSQVSVFSGFNQPADISMSRDFEALCGITEEELYRYFAEPIAKLAEENDCSVDEMKQMLKKQYDGYHFGKRMTDIYNPFSILNAFYMCNIDDYWFRSGTPSYLIRLLNHTQENLNELTGKYYDTSEFIDYKADVEKPLPMIYQSGYLTIKNFDKSLNLYTLGFPNDEVKYGFLKFLIPYYTPISSDETDFNAVKFVRELQSGDVHSFMERMKSFFADIPYELNTKTERHYQVIFYLVFKLMGQYVDAEVRSAKGRADAVVKTKDRIYVFEFKLEGTVDEALKQIDEKGYLLPYRTDGRELVKVGVSFNAEERNIGEYKVV